MYMYLYACTNTHVLSIDVHVITCMYLYTRTCTYIHELTYMYMYSVHVLILDEELYCKNIVISLPFDLMVCLNVSIKLMLNQLFNLSDQ